MPATLAWIAACALVDLIAGLLAVWRLGPAALAGWRGPELLLALFLAILLSGWAFCLYRRPARRLLPSWLVRMEWRVATILIATGLSLVPTLAGFFLDLQDEHGGFTKDLFAGWVVSVVFFGLVGLIVAVVSLVNAAREDFDARARVLVRGRSGRHIDDFIDRLRTSLAHYAQSVTRTFTVIGYDQPTGMYKVCSESVVEIRSYVDDIETVYASGASYKPDLPPPPGQFHRLCQHFRPDHL